MITKDINGKIIKIGDIVQSVINDKDCSIPIGAIGEIVEIVGNCVVVNYLDGRFYFGTFYSDKNIEILDS